MATERIEELPDRRCYMIQTWNIGSDEEITYGPCNLAEMNLFRLGLNHRRYRVRYMHNIQNAPEFQAGQQMHHMAGDLDKEATEKWDLNRTILSD